jgi:hypothetical protein
MVQFSRAALLATLVCACGPALPQGQFGPYYRHSKHLALASGDTLTVYRVKAWTFSSGEEPALQIEYEAPFPVSDTAAIRREVRLIWPAFAPYLEVNHFTGAIITATNLRIHGIWPIAWSSTHESFGFVADKEANGGWHVESDTTRLPPADASGIPRIIDVTGQPLPFVLPLPPRAPK